MKYVALFEKRRYILGYFNEAGGFMTEWKDLFPTVFKAEVKKEILDEIPDLRYSESEYEFTIWNKKVNETSKLVVPVYTKMFDEYKYTGKTYTFEIPTKESLNAAKKMVREIECRMGLEKYKTNINELEKRLEAGKGITFISGEEMPEVYSVCKLTGKLGLWYDDFYNHVVGDPDMVTSTTLKLYVPEELMPKIIGKGGKKVKEMATKMRVNKIHVLPLEKKSED